MRFRVVPAGKPLSGIIRVPRDKSIAHRYLLLSALAKGSSYFPHFPKGQDNLTTLRFVSSLGAEVEWERGGVKVFGFFRSPQEPEDLLSMENSGTTTRLGMGIVAGYPITATFTGDSSLRKRPMGRVTEPLRKMGAVVVGRKGGDLLPITVSGPVQYPLSYEIPQGSAQVKSALLLCGLVSGIRVEIQERYRSRDHTERLLTYLGYSLKREGNTWILEEDLSHEGFSLPIPRDPSSASFFAFLSAMRGDGEISFPEILLNPTRLQFFFWLERMGVKLRWEVQEKEPEEWGTLSLSGKVTTSVEVKPEEIPLGIDELPLLMLSGLFLESGMEVRGAEELRKKESDRIRVTGEIARAFGGEVEELPDGLRVFPGKGVRKKERVVIDPHGDHRMAMAGVVTGIALGVPVEVLSGEVVRVSFPNFFSLLSRTGVAVVEKV